MRSLVGLATATALVVATVGVFFVASAQRYSSTNYVIDASVMNNAGGATSSTSYKLVSSTGESIVGNGASGSYKMGAGYVAQLQESAPQSITVDIQTNGLVAHYPLDESSGLYAYDLGRNGYIATAAVAPDRTTGVVSGALGPISVGSNKYLQTSETAAFDTPYMSACGWAYKTATSTNPSIVTHTNGALDTEGMWHVGYGNATRPRFVIRLNATDNLVTATNTTTLNAWHHVCGTYDGATMKLYVDGVLDGSLAVSGSLPAVATPLTIGARFGGSQVSDLQALDEIKVFSRALLADEVAAEYAAGLQGVGAGVSLGAVTPGVPAVVNSDVVIATMNVPNYSLSISQNHDLQNGSDTIAPIAGTIASPAAWSDGTTKGFGFSVVSAPGLDSKWGAGANYAASPGTPTVFYSRSGASNSTKDVAALRFKVDTPVTTPSGNYTNQLTVTGTIVP